MIDKETANEIANDILKEIEETYTFITKETVEKFINSNLNDTHLLWVLTNNQTFLASSFNLVKFRDVIDVSVDNTMRNIQTKVEQLIKDFKNSIGNRNMNDLEQGKYDGYKDILDLLDKME